MVRLSMTDQLILLQYAINKYDSENVLKEKLKDVMAPKGIERGIDMLIGTQKVRRIGTAVLQNNFSYTGELPTLPDHLKPIIDSLML
jgi:hypothetical protein